MKLTLVEILARELPEWPEGVEELHQWSDGEVTGRGFSAGYKAIASDREDAKVTRAQWEAERARILSESQPERDPVISEEQREKIAKDWWSKQMQKSRLELMPEENPQYEQKLWDRAALKAMQAFITGHISHHGHEDVWPDIELVSVSADYADAFMAERAKRLKP